MNIIKTDKSSRNIEEREEAKSKIFAEAIEVFKDACASHKLERFDLYVKESNDYTAHVFRHRGHGKEVTLINDTVTVSTKSCGMFLQYDRSREFMYNRLEANRLFGVGKEWFLSNYRIHKDNDRSNGQ